jgi:hypothetical protein
MSWDLNEPECITQARLMVASPEFVYDQLRYYGENVDHLWDGKENLEKSLLTRNDKLANLALARHGTRKEIILDLYNRASAAAAKPDYETYKLGIRVACLSNRHFHYFNWPDFDLYALMAKGLTAESYALITNPTVPDSLLESLYRKSDCFAQVAEPDWLQMVRASAENKRLNIDKSNKSPDLGFWNIHKAIFHFLEAAPVTSQSVVAASELLNALEPQHCAWPDEISHVIDRWRKAEVKDCKGEAQEGWSTPLPLNEELACLIGALYGRRSTSQKNKPPLFGSASDEDIALRCAYYGCAQMSEKEVAAGYEKDKDVFLFAAVKNRSLYLSKETRALLGSYVAGKRFVHEYKRRCQDIDKKYKWVDDVMENLNPEPSREIELLENIDRQNAVLLDQVAACERRVAAYERHLYWAVIIVIGAMYYLLRG